MKLSACVCGFTPPDTFNPDCERCVLVRRIAELETQLADSKVMLRMHENWLEHQTGWLEQSAALLDIAAFPDVPRGIERLQAEIAHMKNNPIRPDWQPLIKIAHCWLGGRRVEKDELTEAFRSFLFSFNPMPNPEGE